MRTGQKLYWLLVVATSGLYAVMVFWAGPKLLAMSSLQPRGLPFDVRMFGYGHAQAQEYLASLTPGGLAFYTGPLIWLDTAFPAMLCLVLAIGGWWLLAERALPLRLAMAVIALGYGVFDYLENVAVFRMLTYHGGPENLPVSLVATASQWTVLKFFFLDATVTVLIVLLVARLIARLQASAE